MNIEDLSKWINEQWVDIFYAIVFAVIVGLIFEYIYDKIRPKPKISKKTINVPEHVLANFILPNNETFIMHRESRTFGREDFLGTLSTDGLSFIGQRHFKISKKDGNFYLKDLNSKNGTKLNGTELEDKEVLLSDGDQILVANTVEMKFSVQK